MDGKSIKELRVKWQLRQPDMALLLGVTSSHLSRIETGAPVSILVQQILTLLALMSSLKGHEVAAAIEYGQQLSDTRQDARQMLILLRLMRRAVKLKIDGLDIVTRAVGDAETALWG